MAFTRFTKNVLNVSALPDRVQNQAQTLKATFDQAGVDIKSALNALIAELEASTSANNIGADVQSVATKTVQAILTAFEEEIANRYTKTEAETLLSTGTNDLVADVDVNLTTGIITITKKDGTVETFDTAIEKVPAKFEIIENGDTFVLKITNVDGTSTQTDITNFMNIYNFNNSDYITFEVTGEGTQRTVTANIKANSIGLDKLSLSVVSTLEGYVTSAKDSATSAKTSEINAKNSENVANEKAEEAKVSASEAKYWAEQSQAGGGGGGGIYIGETEPTDPNISVWIDTTGEADEYVEVPEINSIITKVESNKVYRGEISESTAFILPEIIDDTILNSIQIQVEISNYENITLDLGVTSYFGDIPELGNGSFILYYEFNGTSWCVGALPIVSEV